MLQNYNNILTILNYSRINPRSRPPQKKIRIFYAPRFFNIYIYIYLFIYNCSSVGMGVLT